MHPSSSARLRFGDIAIAKGYATSDQVMVALFTQINEKAEGKPHRRIGEILCSMGVLTMEHVADVVREMAKRGSVG